MGITGKVRLSNSAHAPEDFDFEILDGITIPPPIPLPISNIVIHNSPTDIFDWIPTLSIKRIEMNPSFGFKFTFDKIVLEYWKWFTGNGDDNYQYTVWPIITFNKILHSSGIVQMWQGRDGTGPFELPLWHDDFHANWCYDSRWGDMSLYYPNPGDVMGFFVSAGNARGQAGITSVKERSNVVVITLPQGDVGDWSF